MALTKENVMKLRKERNELQEVSENESYIWVHEMETVSQTKHKNKE